MAAPSRAAGASWPLPNINIKNINIYNIYNPLIKSFIAFISPIIIRLNEILKIDKENLIIGDFNIYYSQ